MRIFDIERSSTADGPGIRTVVFFKGCNMRCRWCHNAEGILGKTQLLWNENKCISCGHCVGKCSAGAHSLINGYHLFDEKKCRECLKCTQVCFTGALSAVGRDMSASEIFEILLQDRLIYAKSGGGVTLSGGEVMLQAASAAELLEMCKKVGISTAIETNLSLPWELYEEVLPFVDICYADIKHTDKALHKNWTGISNEMILVNLEKLKAEGIPFVIRTPIIPGFNDSAEVVSSIATLLSGTEALKYYELLSYNPLGRSKGTLVGAAESTAFEIPAREKMRSLALSAARYAKCVYLDGKEVSPDHASIQ
jgi:pyruvate formate lyase activating enzyme